MIRGTDATGREVHESTKTTHKATAEGLRVKKEGGLLIEAVHGKKAVVTFDQAVESYLDNGGSDRFLGKFDTATGAYNGLMGHLNGVPLRKITQSDMNTIGKKLYPKVQSDTLNRQLWTPFIAVWRHAVAMEWADLRMWIRPKIPKGTTVVRTRPERAGTKPVEYSVAWEFVRKMSPGPASLMTALFYTGMRPIEMFALSSQMVNVPDRWITLNHSKIGEPRGVPLHEFLVPLFTPLVERGGILFLSRLGTPYPIDDGESGQMKTAIIGAQRRSGHRHVAPYTARHTTSTQLVIEGVHPHIKDQILGHAVDSMSRRYTNVPQAPMIAAINKLPVIEAWSQAPWMTDPIGHLTKFVAGTGRRTDLIKQSR
ncbi:tyrosine-type recombinase/integrase [Tardiphaga sp. vice352]|uniref:tyrosine-type recombinase/integrase n=1 Tax=Tardiphaga sp. vice352 TaxID=2592816 RepID=UPI0034A00F1B